MTDLDAALRRMKAESAHRLRGEALDLQREASAKIGMAEVIEHTWALPPQRGEQPSTIHDANDRDREGCPCGRYERPCTFPDGFEFCPNYDHNDD